MKVFISYAEKDIDVATRLYSDLTKAGITTWLDEEDILPGQKWKKIKEIAIKESSHFLLLLSSNSVSEKGYVHKELKIALNLSDEYPDSEIFIIPVKLDECEVVDDKLQEIESVDMYSSYEKGLNRILKVLHQEFITYPDDDLCEYTKLKVTERRNEEMENAFLIMNNSPKYKEVYRTISKAFDEKGYRFEKIDNYEPEQTIVSIINTDIILVDISENSPSIFYKLGVCHSIGNKTIIINSDDNLNQIPSELISYPPIKYSHDKKGQELLFFQVQKAIDKLKRDKSEFERTKKMRPNNLVQEVGQYYFDQRIKIEEKLENLNNEIARATKFKKLVEDDFPIVDNSKVAEKIVLHIKGVLYKNTTVRDSGAH